MADIDQLNIKVVADTAKAEEAISKLADRYKDLANAMRVPNPTSGMKQIATSAEKANQEEKRLIGTTKELDKELGKMSAPKNVATDYAKAMMATFGDALKKVGQLKFAPRFQIPKELEEISGKIDSSKFISEDARKKMNAQLIAPLAKSIKGSEAISNAYKVRASLLEAILERQEELGKKSAEDVASEKQAAEAAKERATAYSEAYKMMREAAGITAVKSGSGFFSHGQLYDAADFMPGGSRYGTTSPVAPETASETDTATESVSRFSKVVSGAQMAMGFASGAASELATHMRGFVASVASTALHSFARVLHMIADGAMNMAKSIARVGIGIFRKEVQLAVSATRKFVGAIAQLSGFLTSLPFRPLASMLGKVTGGMGRTRKATSGLTTSIRHGLRFVIKYIFGFRSLFYMMRKIRTATKEAFGNLAHVSSNTNENLSLLSSRLSQLKNSLASAFDPILTVVTPILDYLIQKLIAAFNAIGQFFAAITGAKTWHKATFSMKDFAASADSSADSSGNAKDAAEDLKKSLMGFDKINKLDDADSSSGSGGSGGGGGGSSTDYAGMFTTETVSNSISDFADKFKQAWQEADFTEIGKIVGDKLALSLLSIEWEKVQAYSENVGKSVATFINGAISSELLPTAIGTTIAGVINSGIALAWSFVDTLKFDAIGGLAADALNLAIATIEYDELANALSGGVNGVFDLASTWADKFKFGALGTAIESTVNKTLGKIEWKKAKSAAKKIGNGLATALNKFMTKKTFKNVGNTVAEAFNTAVEGAYSLVSKIEWKKWGSAVASGINKFFKTFNFKKAGLTLSTLGKGLLSAAIAAVKGVSWRKVGEKVAEMLKAIEWADIISKLSESAGSIAGAIAEFASGLFADLPGAISEVLTIEWIQTNIIDPFVKGFQDVTGKTPIEFTIDTIASFGKWIFGEGFDTTITGLSIAVGAITLAAGVKAAISGVSALITSVAPAIGVPLILAGVIASIGKLVFESPEVTEKVQLIKDGWESFTTWLYGGEELNDGALAVSIQLVKDKWDSFIAWLFGDDDTDSDGVIDVAIKLVKEGWENFTEWLFGNGDEDGDGAIDVPIKTRTREDIQAEESAIRQLKDLINNGADPDSNVQVQLLFDLANKKDWDTFFEEYEGITGKEVTVTADGKRTTEYKTTSDSYNGLKDNTAKKTITAEEVTAFQIGKADFQSVVSEWATKHLDSDKTTTWDENVKAFFDWVDSDVVKRMSAESRGEYELARDNFIKWVSNDAYKNMYAETGDSYEVLKKAWDEWGTAGDPALNAEKIIESKFRDIEQWGKNKDEWVGFGGEDDSFAKANKIISSSLSDLWDDNKSEYDSLKNKDVVKKMKNKFANWTQWGKRKKNYDKIHDDKAEKELTGEITRSFDNLEEAYYGVKGNTTAKVTISGSSNGSFLTAVSALMEAKLQNFQTALRLAKDIRGNALGGAFFGGSWHNIAQYAMGGIPSHGSLFVAGEAGAEMVGHVNGRTEVLNQSQMASVMYDAVVRGVVQAMAMSGNNTDVHIHLDGDARGLFKVVQKEANNYANATGRPAFNL